MMRKMNYLSCLHVCGIGVVFEGSSDVCWIGVYRWVGVEHESAHRWVGVMKYSLPELLECIYVWSFVGVLEIPLTLYAWLDAAKAEDRCPWSTTCSQSRVTSGHFF